MPIKTIKAGNLDPNKAIAFVKNKDGTTSTVRTMSVNFGEGEVLIPTVHPNGYIMDNNEAIERYRKTGQNFGTFETVEDANKYAQALHETQAKITPTK
jgi:hypothetical protein